MDVPTELWCVVFEQSLYFHPPDRRKARVRIFTDPQFCADWIDALLRWPRHHAVLGVFHMPTTEWEFVAPDELPEPKERVDDE